jgi:hypothetical protein
MARARHLIRSPKSLATIERSILRVRGTNVIVDADLATFYGTTVKRLNQQVARNAGRFPTDFCFQLTPEELQNLRSQIVTSSAMRHGGRRYLPYVFTEHGAVMAANVLKSSRAVAMSVAVVRAFVRLRQILQTHAELGRKIDALEVKYDGQFAVVFQAIRNLMVPVSRSRRRIGFRPHAPDGARR